MNKNFKNSFKVASNILLMICLILMVVTVWLDQFYLSIVLISLSLASIFVTLLSLDGFNLHSLTKELNTYFFIVTIIVALSVTLTNQIIFYVGLALFILMILLYIIPAFFEEKEDRRKRK
jgi:hypothetical protein